MRLELLPARVASRVQGGASADVLSSLVNRADDVGVERDRWKDRIWIGWDSGQPLDDEAKAWSDEGTLLSLVARPELGIGSRLDCARCVQAH